MADKERKEYAKPHFGPEDLDPDQKRQMRLKKKQAVKQDLETQMFQNELALHQENFLRSQEEGKLQR